MREAVRDDRERPARAARGRKPRTGAPADQGAGPGRDRRRRAVPGRAEPLGAGVSARLRCRAGGRGSAPALGGRASGAARAADAGRPAGGGRLRRIEARGTRAGASRRIARAGRRGRTETGRGVRRAASGPHGRRRLHRRRGRPARRAPLRGGAGTPRPLARGDAAAAWWPSPAARARRGRRRSP